LNSTIRFSVPTASTDVVETVKAQLTQLAAQKGV
jgi:sporulation-control protein